MKYINKYDTYAELVAQQLEVPTLNFVDATKKLYYKKFGDTSFTVIDTALSKTRTYEYTTVDDPSVHISGMMTTEDMNSYFSGEDTLKEIWFNSNFKPTSTYNAFKNCHYLTAVHNLNMNNNDICRMTFSGCVELTTIDGSFNMSNVDKINNMFSSCAALTDIPAFINLGSGFTSTNKSYHTLDLRPTAITGANIETKILSGLADLSDVSTAVTPVIRVTYEQGQAISAAAKTAAAAKGWTLQIDNAS